VELPFEILERIGVKADDITNADKTAKKDPVVFIVLDASGTPLVMNVI
jgi:hypothetical protein